MSTLANGRLGVAVSSQTNVISEHSIASCRSPVMQADAGDSQPNMYGSSNYLDVEPPSFTYAVIWLWE